MPTARSRSRFVRHACGVVAVAAMAIMEQLDGRVVGVCEVRRVESARPAETNDVAAAETLRAMSKEA